MYMSHVHVHVSTAMQVPTCIQYMLDGEYEPISYDVNLWFTSRGAGGMDGRVTSCVILVGGGVGIPLISSTTICNPLVNLTLRDGGESRCRDLGGISLNGSLTMYLYFDS